MANKVLTGVGYQIEIVRDDNETPVDMAAIRAALADFIAPFDQVNQRGREGEFVYVDTGYIGDAVEIIKSLGYGVDADSELDSEPDADD